jgi:predicted transcriptional regulator
VFNTESLIFVLGMAIANMYDIEIIQKQTKYRRTVDIMAAILKVVIRGEGTKRDIENGANLSFLQVKQYLLLLLNTDLLTKDQEKESIYRITQKAIRFLHLYEQLDKMIQYPRKYYKD